MRPTLWKWNPHKVAGHTLISPNTGVSVRENAKKSVASTTHKSIIDVKVANFYLTNSQLFGFTLLCKAS